MPSELPSPSAITAHQLRAAACTVRRAVAAVSVRGGITLPLLAEAFSTIEAVARSRFSATAVALSAPQPPREQYSEDFASALSEYRAALKEWNLHLPAIRGWLLAEKARLKQGERHAASLGKWIDASRQTHK